MRALFVRLIVLSVLALVVVQLLGGVWSTAQHDKRQHDEFLPEMIELAAERLGPLQGRAREHEMHRLRQSLKVGLDIHGPVPPRSVTRTLPDGTVLYASGGPPPPRMGWLAVQILLSTLAICAIVAWLGRPLLRDLVRLERATQAIAAGDLSARTGLETGPVGEVGQRFDAMAGRVQTTLSDQRNLLQAVSHELRTPMARMRFQLEAAADSPERSLRALDGELDVIDGLLRELLTVQMLDQPRLGEPEPEHSTSVVEDTIERVQPLGDAQIISTIEGSLPIGSTDLERIVSNLLTNAIRHARSQIEVRVRPGLLQVQDDGPGIPVHERARIFEPFASLDPSRNRSLGGVGLGLAIVQRAARRWGAEVTVDSGPLGGARFSVRWTESS